MQVLQIHYFRVIAIYKSVSHRICRTVEKTKTSCLDVKRRRSLAAHFQIPGVTMGASKKEYLHCLCSCSSHHRPRKQLVSSAFLLRVSASHDVYGDPETVPVQHGQNSSVFSITLCR